MMVNQHHSTWAIILQITSYTLSVALDLTYSWHASNLYVIYFDVIFFSIERYYEYICKILLTLQYKKVNHFQWYPKVGTATIGK